MTYGGTIYAGTTYGGTASTSISGQVQGVDTDTSASTITRTVRASGVDVDITATTLSLHPLVSAIDVDISGSPVTAPVGYGATTYGGGATASGEVDADYTGTVLTLHPTLTPTDTDTSASILTLAPELSAVDTDTGDVIARILAITDANDPVQAVVDILAESQLPNPTLPDAVAPLSQNRPKARKGEEKAIWVWSSASTDIDDFDAEYSRTTRTATVEAILQLNQSDREGDFADVATFAEDVVQLLSRYARDNKTKTQFHSIKVVQREDRRAQNIPTNSLPYDVALTIELSRLVETA